MRTKDKASLKGDFPEEVNTETGLKSESDFTEQEAYEAEQKPKDRKICAMFWGKVSQSVQFKHGV